MQVIGGIIGLEDLSETDEKPLPLSVQLKSAHWLANGRSALFSLMMHLRPSVCWVPSYICESVLQPLEHVRFYAIDYNLEVSDTRWIEEVSENDLVIIVDYFGFHCNRDLVHLIQQRQAWVLIDAAHAWLSQPVDSGQDYTIFSPRKFAGMPDGGILTARYADMLPNWPLEDAPETWWNKVFTALLKRRIFDQCGGDRLWLKMYQEAEANGPAGPFKMSELSQKLIRRVDWSAIAQKRRVNYQALLNHLGEFALFPDLKEAVVPLGFPIRLPQRNRIREALFSHEIYPSLYWRIDNVIPHAYQQSHQLAEDMMVLHCDQRYDDADMDRIAGVIRENM